MNFRGFPVAPYKKTRGPRSGPLKLLITLSDGKPEDYDGYYLGEYGIEDTRQALFEARRDGIHPFCITIDETAREYLPHMYGAANYIVIKDVAAFQAAVQRGLEIAEDDLPDWGTAPRRLADPRVDAVVSSRLTSPPSVTMPSAASR